MRFTKAALPVALSTLLAGLICAPSPASAAPVATTNRPALMADSAIPASAAIDQNVIKNLNPYVHVADGKYVLAAPANVLSGINKEALDAVNTNISDVNGKVDRGEISARTEGDLSLIHI